MIDTAVSPLRVKSEILVHFFNAYVISPKFRQKLTFKWFEILSSSDESATFWVFFEKCVHFGIEQARANTTPLRDGEKIARLEPERTQKGKEKKKTNVSWLLNDCLSLYRIKNCKKKKNSKL